MKIKYIDEKNRENEFEKGSHIVLISSLPDEKPRHGYVLECESPTKIIVQMETSSDQKETGEIVEINGKKVIIQKHYQVKIDINKNKVLNTKKDIITDKKIEEIIEAANKSIINALEKGIPFNPEKLNPLQKNEKLVSFEQEKVEDSKTHEEIVVNILQLNKDRKVSEIEEYKKDKEKDKEKDKDKKK